MGLAYHGNAAETGEYLYDPSYAPTLDIGQVVHTLNTWSTWSAVINLTSRAGELRRACEFLVEPVC